MPRKIIDELLNEIELALSEFDAAMPEIQKAVYKEIELLVRELELSKTGNVIPNIENLKKLNQIKGRLDKVFNNPDYIDNIVQFGKSFTAITNIQEKYFNAFLPEFKDMPKAIFELRKQAVEQVVFKLSGKGMSVNLIDKSVDILRKNVTTGASFFDLNSEMREFIMGEKKDLGELQRYTKQITTDLLNNYAATVNKIVSDDLGLNWGTYVGALVKASRSFCLACVEKEFIHKSEVPKILKGEIDGKVVSLAGLKPNTTPENFQVNRGGYQCNHLYLPVSDSMVPKILKDKIS